MASIYSVIVVTVPDKKAADTLSEGLVKRKLAACVNAVPGVSSVYWWEEKLNKAEETMLLIKTRSGLLPEITEFVKQNHPYSVPEIIVMDIQDGSEDYLNWLGSHCLFCKPRTADGGRRTGQRP